MAKILPTHIIISILSVQEELTSLNNQLSSPTNVLCGRELIQGKIEAYTAIMMQEKIVVPLKKVL